VVVSVLAPILPLDYDLILGRDALADRRYLLDHEPGPQECTRLYIGSAVDHYVSPTQHTAGEVQLLAPITPLEDSPPWELRAVGDHALEGGPLPQWVMVAIYDASTGRRASGERSFSTEVKKGLGVLATVVVCGAGRVSVPLECPAGDYFVPHGSLLGTAVEVAAMDTAALEVQVARPPPAAATVTQAAAVLCEEERVAAPATPFLGAPRCSHPWDHELFAVTATPQGAQLSPPTQVSKALKVRQSQLRVALASRWPLAKLRRHFGMILAAGAFLMSSTADSAVVGLAVPAAQRRVMLELVAPLGAHLNRVLVNEEDAEELRTPLVNSLLPLGQWRCEDLGIMGAVEDMCQQLPPHVRQVSVDLTGWTQAQVVGLGQVLVEHQELFSKDKWDIGKCDALPFTITLKPGVEPVRQRAYRYSPKLTELVKVEIDRLLAAGIIRPSQSAWASPLVAILKKDGSVRCTVNFKRLNAVTVVPAIPIPNIEDILNSLSGSSYYTAMDVTSGFFTSAINEASIPLTATITSFGLFEWLRCPQGAAGSPGHFSRLMALVLEGLERVQLFIDDLLAHSSTLEEHLRDLELLFARLRHFHVRLAPKKVFVGSRSVNYLGHVIEPRGIRADPKKVAALLEMPPPRDVSALRSWLGLANYYRRFVPRMALIVAPLNNLLRKEVPFVFNAACTEAWQSVNTQLASHTLVHFPDYAAAAAGTRPFLLATDASIEGLGAVLSQLDERGRECPIAFASRTTLAAERNWSVTDLEAGAIVFGVKKFRHMLWGTPFVIYTDHRALQYLESARDKTPRLARWFEFLGAFQYEVRYRKGSQHENADGVSRNPLPATAQDAHEEEEEEVQQAYAIREEEGGHRHEARCCTAVLEVMERVEETLGDVPVGTGAGVSELPENLANLSPAEWRQAQEEDGELKPLRDFARDKTLPPAAATEATALVARWGGECLLDGDGVLWRKELGRCTHHVQLVLPKQLRPQLLNGCHAEPWGGHQGIARTMGKVQRHAWWPTWTQDVRFWCTRCFPCQARKKGAPQPRMDSAMREAPPAAAFEEISIDLFGPLPASKDGHTMILAVKCLHSRYVEAFPLLPSQADSAGIGAVLVDQYFTRHGVPRTVLSDKGSQFTSALAQALFEAMNIRKLSSSAYHPQTNGSVERFMRTLAEMLAMLVNAHHDDWHLWVAHVVFAHNTAVNRSTGVEPFLLAYGRLPRLAMHQILGQLDQRLRGAAANRAVKQVVSDMLERQARAQEMARCRGEAHRAAITKSNSKLAEAFGLKDRLHTGGLVWLYRTPRTIKGVEPTRAGEDARGTLAAKFLDPWSGPFEIVQVGPSSRNGVQVGDNVVLVRMHTGREERYNRQWLKPCYHPEDSPPTSLPDGFARYLLRRHSAEVPAPLALDDNEATWASDRHGVTAIQNHRLVTQGRGKPAQLQYLVEWDGKDLIPSWEPAANVDACLTALQEYWRTLAGSTAPIEGHRTTIIRQQLRRAGGQVAAKGVGWQEARVGVRYELPKGCSALARCPSKALEAGELLGAWIYFAFDVKSAQPEWSPGIIKGYHGKGATAGKFTGQYGIQFMYESGQRGVKLDPQQYSCKQVALAGDWFVWGTAGALAKVE
jgi:hypothetical protein